MPGIYPQAGKTAPCAVPGCGDTDQWRLGHTDRKTGSQVYDVQCVVCIHELMAAQIYNLQPGQ
jgi:hypothetical protein